MRIRQIVQRVALLPSYRLVIRITMAAGVLALVLISTLSSAPSSFPDGTILRISKDMSVTAAASMLKQRGVIRSAYLYKIYVTLVHDGKGVQAGSYLFDRPQSALRVAYRTSFGLGDMQKIKVTITEGSNSKEIGATIKRSIPSFDSQDFISKAKESEGYLFPETYFFDPDVTPDEVISFMREQFEKQIKSISSEIASSSMPLSDIIVMASIIEEEANNERDRRIISGILWKRIAEDMPLQVDAPFYYLLGKGSSQLTRDDLAAVSPYNTYVNKGLPAAPISNPGLQSIFAALNPEETPYYFYLSDREGVTHYAATHDGHVANKARYLQ